MGQQAMQERESLGMIVQQIYQKIIASTTRDGALLRPASDGDAILYRLCLLWRLFRCCEEEVRGGRLRGIEAFNEVLIQRSVWTRENRPGANR